jgi:DNA-directed RNA polymerase subunit RPC12/RpoP
MAKIDPEELCPCESGLLFKECHGLKVKKPTVPEITQEIPLVIIPEPDPNTRAVFNYIGEGTTVFRGSEVGLALVCGKCKSSLVVGIPRNAISDIVIRCNNCGSFNEV